MNRGLIAHFILAAGGMAAAYFVWTAEEPGAGREEVTISDCEADDVSRIALVTETRDTTLELGREDGLVGRVTLTNRPAEGAPTTDAFVASAALSEALSQLAPLRARRSLGELSATELAQVGLEAPTERLTIYCDGETRTFELGERAYGNGDRYVRVEGQGPVYLVASDRLQPIESAEQRLMQRELHAFAWTEVVELTVRAFGEERRLLQRNRHDERAAEWVDAESPERRNELYGNWLSRYPRLRAQRYLAADAEPGADLEAMSAPAREVMRISLRGEDGELGVMELSAVDGAEVAYYARTETTRGWVRVPGSVAQALEEDLRPVVGLEPAAPRPIDPARDPALPPPVVEAAPPVEPTPPLAPHSPAHSTPADPAPVDPSGPAPAERAPPAH